MVYWWYTSKPLLILATQEIRLVGMSSEYKIINEVLRTSDYETKTFTADVA
jgi:hypothetical protein